MSIIVVLFHAWMAYYNFICMLPYPHASIWFPWSQHWPLIYIYIYMYVSCLICIISVKFWLYMCMCGSKHGFLIALIVNMPHPVDLYIDEHPTSTYLKYLHSTCLFICVIVSLNLLMYIYLFPINLHAYCPSVFQMHTAWCCMTSILPPVLAYLFLLYVFWSPNHVYSHNSRGCRPVPSLLYAASVHALFH